MLGTADPVTTTPRLTVRAAEDSDRARWTGFVQGRAGATFCHLWEWRDVLRESFGLRPLYLLAEDESGALAGALPLVEMRAGIAKHHISLPYLNYGGPLGTPEARRQLVEAAVAAAGERGAARLELRSRGTAEALNPSRAKVTVVLPLPGTVEELWNGTFRSKLRSQIRRAQREEMEVRFGPGEKAAFYDVFRRNMRDLGTPVLPRRFFDEVAARLGDRVEFASVRFGEVPVAAGCGFVFGGEFEISWASSLREYNAKAPNMLLYASLMEEMIRRGVTAFNFGRCTPGAGTHRFKLQWGGSDEPLNWTEWPGAGAAREDGSPGRVMQLASRAWQRLPLPVADLLGPRLAARMPQF